MTKQRILDEIRRTAAANGGAPLGKRAFESDTGIKESDWSGRFWARWGDAVREAGLTPNTLNPRAQDDNLLGPLAKFIRELGRYPTVAEMRMRKREDDAFPNHKVLERRGSRHQLIDQLVAYSQRTKGLDDVLAICLQLKLDAPEPIATDDGDELVTGYVYLALMKVGRERRYKIGKANLVEQRARQVAVNLPEELELIHAITTDDAYGIESYWHRRFADKRRGGEWFELSATDVRAFRRRKFQ